VELGPLDVPLYSEATEQLLCHMDIAPEKYGGRLAATSCVY
jgi:hypothetical protein